MTVYNINLGIGWASSGVEYAQAYRASVFRQLGIEAKFIFMDMFQSENLQHLTENIGLKDDEVIWLYSYFTDFRLAPSTYSVEALEASFSDEVEKIERNGKLVRYHYKAKELYITAFLRDENANHVQRVEYVSRGALVRKDYFTYGKLFSEYYAPKNNQAHLYQRTFFNENGSVAYEETLVGDRSVFRFPNRVCYSKDELIAYFLEKLNLKEKDVVLLDRATGIGQTILQHRHPAKLAVVVHAEHFSVNATTDDNILWNNYYEYQFSNADKVDAFITSTEAQKKMMRRQFKRYTKHRPNIVAIPVGSLDKLRKAGGRRPYSMLTCSRLAGEKHIDWLVNAVILAHENLPELQFDIYGEGGQREKLRQLIEQGKAEDYIHLKGHQELSDVYQDYEMYLSASTSEGFGLTLLEAVGSGLPIIGLDVPYGNQTFVTHAKNGYLIERGRVDVAKEMAEQFAEKIVKLFTQANLSAFHEASYDVAKPFLDEAVKEQWRDFIEEMTNGD